MRVIPKIFKKSLQAVMVSIFIFSSTAGALAQGIYSQLQAPFYDPDSGSSSGSGCATLLPGSDNQQKVWNFFVGKVGAQQIAAIMGNWQVESGITTNAYNINGQSTTTDNPDPSGHFGLAQWGGNRQLSLRQYATSHNLPITDLGAQLNFAWQELNGSYKSSVLDPIISANDLAKMVDIINNRYEVSGTPDGPRLSAAVGFLTQYGSDTGDKTTGSSISCTGSSGSGGCINPFPNGWVPNRLDMGYDGTFSGQIVAPCSGTITYASSSFSNWGGWIELKLDRPVSNLPTSTLYFAEGVAPKVSSGRHVNAGDPIASPALSPYGNAYGTTPNGAGQIEWGVAQDGPTGSPTNTYVYGECGSSAATQSVFAFVKWAESLGVAEPATTSNAGCP
jgi:hypothetical protein